MTGEKISQMAKDASRLIISGYEQGFAEGKQMALAPFEREIAQLNRVEWTEQNLVCFVFNIQDIIEQMKEGVDNDNT